MGIGASIAAAVILAPFFILYVSDPVAVMPEPPQGISSSAALDPPLPRPSIELLLENASPVLGSPDAPITLVEFGDYQCGFCHRHFVQTEPAIISEYVNTGLVKMVFKDLIVIGPDSITAAHAAQCANEQDLYWEFHDAIYDNYQGERTGWASIAGMTQIASNMAALDEDQWATCMQDMRYIDAIDASSQDARALGLGGTPAFYVIGDDDKITLMRGAKPLAEFRLVFDDAITDT